MREILEADVARIREVLSEALGIDGFSHIERMGGLTNHSYHITTENGEDLAVRLPGEGTEAMISRKDEETSTRLACSLGIDSPLLYFGSDGVKITKYIKDAITMSDATMKKPENMEKAASIFKTLHTSGVDTGVPFEVFDMAANYEKVIANYNVEMFVDYQDIKARVMEVKKDIDSRFGLSRVPCHNDPLCENWVLGNEQMYLIDWEYAGMNDGMWDLAALSIEASYGKDEDELLLRLYNGKAPDKDSWCHLIASKIYVDFLWTLWAKTRVPFDGQPMEDWAQTRYSRLKENLSLLTAMEERT